MAEFNYIESQADALELIAEFGANALVLVVSGDYDPVAGELEQVSFSTTEIKAVNLPVTNGLGLKGDKQFDEDLKAGRIKAFYATTGESLFNPEPGALLVWQSKVWDIVAVTGLAPSGISIMFAIGCRESSKFDWATLSVVLDVANDFFTP